VTWIRANRGILLCVAGTVALLALTVLAMTGEVLSRVDEIDGERGGTLTAVALEGAPDLDPARIDSVSGTMVSRAVHRTPYGFRPDRKGAQDDLAEGTPEISDDSRRVKITIRDDVDFSAPVGREVTAHDVAYGIARGFLPSVASSSAQLYFGDIEGAESFLSPDAPLPPGLHTPDDETLEIRLTAPTGRLVAEALTLPLAAPVPQEYAAQFDRLPRSTYGRHQVFTGPYRIKAGPGGLLPAPGAGRIDLERNPVWDSETDFREAFADRIVVEQASNAGVMSRRVLAGTGAVNMDRPSGPDLLRALRTRRDQVELPLSGGITFVALNNRVPPFDDLQVRRAVSAATDQRALRAALGGPAVGDIPTHWIPPGVPGFEEAGGTEGTGDDFLNVPNGSIALARGYLRRAGYPSGRITGAPVLQIVARRQASAPAFAAEARRTFAALGLRTRVRFLPFAAYVQACSRDPAVAACIDDAWQKDLDDAASVLPPLFGRQGLRAGTNDFRFADPEAEELMSEAATTTGEQDRAERWADVDRHVTELAPGVPVVWTREPNLRSADVEGVLDPELASWDLSFTSLRDP
jgi:peptide/nickel transport system substrate-binding protein